MDSTADLYAKDNRYRYNPVSSNNVNNDNPPIKQAKTIYDSSPESVALVEAQARKIAETLGDPKGLNYFCKVSWFLPEHLIWSTLEKAQTKSNPRAYFSKVCSLLLDKRGVPRG